MKLLFITRKVDKDDGLAGFTYNWLNHFAAQVDKLVVICLEKGNADGLPSNVDIYSLGKEKGKNRLLEFFRFQKLAAHLVPQVDAIFSHQNPEYGILIAPWAKLFHKKLIAWYAHGGVSTRLKMLEKLADKIVTSTESGFRLESNKKIVLHQGIDTKQFNYLATFSANQIVLLSISRISVTKNIEQMINLLPILQAKTKKEVVLNIIGQATLDKEQKYLAELKTLVKAKNLENKVNFCGSIANRETPKYYHQADVFLNFSQTGSLDKTILEAMSCGTWVLSNNIAAQGVLSDQQIFSHLDLEALSEKIIQYVNLADTQKEVLVAPARKVVESKHSLELLVKDILALYAKN